MIEAELLQLLRLNPDQAADRLNALVDDFRNGRASSELSELLDSDDVELVRIGAWIVSELHVDHYTRSVVDRLWELTHHSLPAIRFYALGSLFPLLDVNDARTRELVLRLKEDPNQGVRLAAVNTAKRLHIE